MLPREVRSGSIFSKGQTVYTIGEQVAAIIDKQRINRRAYLCLIFKTCLYV